MARALTGAALVAAGVLHFVVPATYIAIVPAWLPSPGVLVAVSGVAECVGGAGLLTRRWRYAASIGVIVLLAAVFPANVQMLLDARAHDAARWWEALLWARLPLQPLLMWWVWQLRR